MRRIVGAALLCASILATAGETKPEASPKPPRRKSLLWPIFGSRTGADSRSLVIFPFLCSGKKPDESHLVILPVYARREKDGSKAELFFPVFSRHTGKTTLKPYANVPHLLRVVDTAEEYLVRLGGVLTELGTIRKDTDKPMTVVEVPASPGCAGLVGYLATKEGKELALLWLLSGQAPPRDPTPGTRVAIGQSLLGVPLAEWTDTEKEKALSLAGLKVGRGAPKSDKPFTLVDVFNLGLLAKVFEFRRSGADWSLDALSVISNRATAEAPSEGTTVAGGSLFGLPFVGYRRNAEGRWFQLFPFLSVGKIETKEGTARHFHIWPFYGTTRHGDDRSWWVAWPFIQRRREPERSQFCVFPFFWRGSDKKADTEHVHVWPLVGWARKGKRREWSVANPLFVYAHEEGAVRHVRAVPLFACFREHGQPDGIIVPPFVKLSRRQKGGDATHLAVVPLFWLYRDPIKKTEVTQILPVLWARDDEAKSRTWGLIPFLWCSRGPDERRFALTPLVGWERKGDHGRFWAILGIIQHGW